MDRRPPGNIEQITGSVERVTFHSEQTGFCVLKVNVRGLHELVTVVGSLPEPRAGEWLDAEGVWAMDKVHGRQFKAQTLRTATPNTKEGIERYLASGLIKGIGPTLASRLVARYGEQVLDIIDTAPKKLLKVDGIGAERLKRIREAWAEQRTVRDIMLFLHSHGVSTSRAFRIYKMYGENAIELVTSDPYRLSRDIWGIGFKSADQIAERLGIARDSILRAKAGVEYVLQQLTNEGHCAYGREDLAKQCAELLDIPQERIEEAVEQALADGRLVKDAGEDAQELIYLATLHKAEVALADDIVGLAGGLHPCPPIDVEKAIRWAEQKVGLSLAAQQRQAIRLATQAKAMVITGGPGVGKTTLVNAILKILAAKHLAVVLCAPTGRAAKRLSETTGIAAKTIHRLLAWDPSSGKFKHHESNPLAGDVFVIDEASMVDLPLAHQVVRAIPRHASLLLVGDVDQLPSVGPGCVLRDVIDSGAVPVCRLTEVFRQAAASAIITNAHRINEGRMPDLSAQAGPSGKPATDFYFVNADEPERGVELIVEMVRKRIPERFGHDPLEDIQVITPMRRGALGANNLNDVLQGRLNPEGPSVERFGQTYRVGDKVMQTVNNYDKDVYNGDIGRIAGVDVEKGELHVRFEGRTIKYDLRELDELSLSYAITVHKSQGSEYPVVIVPIHTQHYVMLQRNLLYTAITRSRKLVVLVGTEKAVAMAVKRASTRRRITTLRQRLQAAASKAHRTGMLPMRFR
jgi:exodeoxyribonuclease V alpha subunit